MTKNDGGDLWLEHAIKELRYVLLAMRPDSVPMQAPHTQADDKWVRGRLEGLLATLKQHHPAPDKIPLGDTA